MGFFDGAGVGLLSALGGAVGSFAGGAMDYKYQKKLMARQNRYNQENASIAYGRQRELTEDQAYLSQLGKLKAGVNTAFGTDGNVTSSANVDQGSPVSVPSPLGMGQQLSTSLRSFMQDSLVNAQRKNVESDTTAKNIDNATRAMENALKIRKLNQDIGVGMLNYAKDAFKFAVDKQYYDRQQSAQTDEMEASAKRAEALQQIEAINAKFAEAKTEADINILKQQFENLKKVYDLTDAQIVTEKGKPRIQISEINKNNASANLLDKQAIQQDKETEFYDDTRELREESIRLDNKYKDLRTIPTRVSDVLIRSKRGRRIISKLEDGGSLNNDDINYLRSLSFLNGVDEKNWLKLLIARFMDD